MSTLREAFMAELSSIYCAETQIVKNLPILAEAAKDPELKEAFETHLSETEDQIKRLEDLFEALHVSAKRKKCKALEALMDEGKELAEDEAGDVALVCAAQKVEHYEIASYQSLIAWARALQEDDALGALEEILEEEELTNDKLMEIADTILLPDAVRNEESEADEEEEETT